MFRSITHIFWLGTKELRAVLGDATMVFLILFVFIGMVYAQAISMPENVNNASIAIVDEDNSVLSRRIAGAFLPPFFQEPQLIEIAELDEGLDQNRFIFALAIPPDFESELRKGSQPEIQVQIDATAMLQAGLGDGYIQTIVNDEVTRYLNRNDEEAELSVDIVSRLAFNPNGEQEWFSALTGILDFLSVVTIMLTGSALIREREHGTIEHLLVMPLTAFEVVAAKIWANGLIIICAFSLSMIFVVEGALDVPVAGSHALLLGGTAIYLFAASAIGILLGTVARTMAQFALLLLMSVIPMLMLSGGMTPIESQPEIVQPFTWLLPSRHYMEFAQAVVFRGAGTDIVWPELAIITGLGAAYLTGSLALFRSSLSAD